MRGAAHSETRGYDMILGDLYAVTFEIKGMPVAAAFIVKDELIVQTAPILKILFRQNIRTSQNYC